MAARVVGTGIVGGADVVGTTGITLTKAALETAMGRSLANGDYLVACISRADDTGTALACSSGGTWTPAGYTDTSVGNDLITGSLYRKVTNAAGEPTSYVFTVTSATDSDPQNVVLFAVSGADPDTFLDLAVATNTGTNDFTPTHVNIDTTTADCLIIMLHGASMGAGSAAKTAGAPAYADGLVGSRDEKGGAVLDSFIEVAYKNDAPAGTQTIGAWTGTPDDSSSEWHVHTLAIRPLITTVATAATVRGVGRTIVNALKTLYPLSPLRAAGRVLALSTVMMPGTATSGIAGSAGRVQAQTAVVYETAATVRGAGRVQASTQTVIATAAVDRAAGRVQAETFVVYVVPTAAIVQGAGRLPSQMQTVISTETAVRAGGRVQAASTVAMPSGVDTEATIRQAGRVQAQSVTQIATESAVRVGGRVQAQGQTSIATGALASGSGCVQAASTVAYGGIDTQATIRGAGRVQVTELKTLYPVGPIRQSGRVQAESTVAGGGAPVATSGIAQDVGRVIADADVRYKITPIRGAGRVQAESTVAGGGAPVATTGLAQGAGRLVAEMEAEYEIGPIRQAGRVQAQAQTIIATTAVPRGSGRVQAASTVAYPGALETAGLAQGAGRIQAATTVQSDTATIIRQAGRIQAQSQTAITMGARAAGAGSVRAETTVVTAVPTSAHVAGAGLVRAETATQTETWYYIIATEAAVRQVGRVQAMTETAIATAATTMTVLSRPFYALTCRSRPFYSPTYRSRPFYESVRPS